MADVFNPNMCTYCQDEISGLKVQCCVCENFIICLQCFSAGAEIGSHKNNHNYKFVLMDNNIMFKGPGNWSAREQLHLLHAVEVLGFGNWEGVSKFIESRTAEELKSEYISRFVDGAIGQATWPGIIRPQMIEDREENTQLTPEQQLASRLPPLDIRVEETRLLGYMPKRDDFDREYNTDTEAEKLVSSLFGGPTEGDELETALKLAQVDMYVRRLRERARRKRVVRDYQLVAKFFTSSRKDLPKQSFTKEQREFRDRMRVFCQFNTGAEHEQLISGLEREQELRLRLSELARYRRAGVTHADECTHYERHTSYDRQRNEPASATSAVALAATAVKTPAQWKHAKSGSSGSDLFYPEAQVAERRDDASDSCSTVPKSTSLTGDIFISECAKYSPTSPSQQLTLQQQRDNTDQVYLTQMLSPKEIKLCTSLNMRPLQYVTLKTVILKDHLAPETPIVEGSATDTNAAGWDIESVNTITKYLVSSGWL